MNHSWENRVQKLGHAFCFGATYSRYCVKFVLTFEPCSPMNGNTTAKIHKKFLFNKTLDLFKKSSYYLLNQFIIGSLYYELSL